VVSLAASVVASGAAVVDSPGAAEVDSAGAADVDSSVPAASVAVSVADCSTISVVVGSSVLFPQAQSVNSRPATRSNAKIFFIFLPPDFAGFFLSGKNFFEIFRFMPDYLKVYYIFLYFSSIWEIFCAAAEYLK
jgi:hypothetical protein